MHRKHHCPRGRGLKIRFVARCLIVSVELDAGTPDFVVKGCGLALGPRWYSILVWRAIGPFPISPGELSSMHPVGAHTAQTHHARDSAEGCADTWPSSSMRFASVHWPRASRYDKSTRSLFARREDESRHAYHSSHGLRAGFGVRTPKARCTWSPAHASRTEVRTKVYTPLLPPAVQTISSSTRHLARVECLWPRMRDQWTP